LPHNAIWRGKEAGDDGETRRAADQERAAAMNDLLLDEARARFARRGVAGTSMEEIAAALAGPSIRCTIVMPGRWRCSKRWWRGIWPILRRF
jgi:DNA-directed RNA polymerase specialized sigma24 family protein